MSESCDKPVCQNNVCDRRTAYSLFQDMQNVITRNLQLIAVELKRAQNYKSHPHSVVFRRRRGVREREPSDSTDRRGGATVHH